VLEQILGIRTQHLLELSQRSPGACSHHRLLHI
jgi:hypothetical protein